MSHLFQAKLIDIITSLIHFVNLVKGITRLGVDKVKPKGWFWGLWALGTRD